MQIPVFLRWQFWPRLVIYAPLLPWITWLALRHRVGLPDLLFAVNPGVEYPEGNYSKYQVYQLFRESIYAIPTILVKAGSQLDEDALLGTFLEAGILMPVIVKPDCSAHSVSIQLYNDKQSLFRFLKSRQGNFMIQPYIDYQHEYSIYLYRIPGEEKIRIRDLTERVLPSVKGNGQNTVEELIEAKEAWNGIAENIKRNYDGDLWYVPLADEVMALSIAATSTRGTIFVNSRHLITEKLVQCMNDMMKGKDFYLGKMDFKVKSEEDLVRGVDLKLLEVNSLGSELNSIFDLRCSYQNAFFAIMKQMQIIFLIASKNKVLMKSKSRSIKNALGVLYRLRQQHQAAKEQNKP